MDSETVAPGRDYIQIDKDNNNISYGEKTQNKPIPLYFRFLDDGSFQIAGTTQIDNNGSFRDGAHLTLRAKFTAGQLVSLQRIIGDELVKRFTQKEEKIQSINREKWAADKRLKEMNDTVGKLVSYTKGAGVVED